jgi:outer membrane protein OmpA-like peptidoglycan-associated protein
MNKTLYIGLAFLASSFLFSCKSKKINLKDGANVVNTNGNSNSATSNYSSNVTKTDRGLMMTFDSDLLFPINSSYLTDKAKIALEEFVSLAKEHPQALIQIDGHTDATGTADYNQWLSEKRAVSVKTYLQSLGVSGSRMQTRGHGQVQPVATNQTKEGRQQNRRVEITVLN